MLLSMVGETFCICNYPLYITWCKHGICGQYMHQELKTQSLQACIPWSQVEGVVGAADDIVAKLLPNN